MKKLRVCFLFAALCMPAASYAFKLNTHVWISQQVIDDLADGYLDIPINGQVQKFPVDPAIKSAILANPKMYRLGNIGPDASPDPIIGQFSIHPGPTLGDNPKGMGTDEWAIALEDYVTNVQNRYSIADIYKYKKDICEKKNYSLDKVWALINTNSNGSSNTSSTSNPWAKQENYNALLDSLADSVIDDSAPQLLGQTTINPSELAYQKGFLGHMAADTFAHSYVNHYAGDVYWLTDSEVEVEKRHAAIESFIDQRLPALPQGAPYTLVPTKNEIPAEFLAEAFIFNDKLKSQYKNYSMTKYAYVLNRYRAAVRAAATDCAWTGISRFAGQAVFYYMTDGAYVPTEKQITAINQLIDKANAANGKLLSQSQEIKTQIDAVVLEQHKKNFGYILSASNKVTKVLNKVIALDQDAKSKAEKVALMISSNQCNMEKDIFGSVCKTALLWPFDKVCSNELITPWCLTNQAYKTAVDLRIKADTALSDAIKANDQYFKDKLVQLRDTMTSIMVTTNLALVATNQLTIAMGSSVDPLQSILTEWDKNITYATTEWVRAHAQVQINSMNLPVPTEEKSDDCWKFGQGIGDCVFKGGSGQEPISEWIAGPAKGLIGMPPSVAALMKSAQDSLAQANQLVQNMDPISHMVQRLIEKKVSVELSGINVTDELLKLINDPTFTQIYKNSHAIFYMKWNDATINSQFASNSTEKWLDTYPKFTDLLYKETGALVPGGAVNPQSFNALTNAITLAKLSLLDSAQLNSIASKVGVGSLSTLYGPKLYTTKSDLLSQTMASLQVNCAGNTECLSRGGASIKSNIDSLPTPWGATNILYGAIKSIDGSEQWKQTSEDVNLKPTNAKLVDGQRGIAKTSQVYYADSYGYGLNENLPAVANYGNIFYKGFRFWQEDPGQPKTGTYFNQLFKMPLYSSPVEKKYRLHNGWSQAWDKYLNNEQGTIAASTIQPYWYSAIWTFESNVDGYFYIKNYWKPSEYLHIENGPLAVGVAQKGWLSAQWKIVEVTDVPIEQKGKVFRLQNRWKPDLYINYENFQLKASAVDPGWHSARWYLDAASGF